jgi:hypothetical protein
MKSYIYKILFFLFPICIIVVILEFLLINIPNDYTFKKEYLDKNASEIETIIFGTSHAFAGLRPEYIDGHTFSVAIGGQSLSYDYKIFKKYQNDFKNLKTIVLAVSYPTLWFRLQDHHKDSSLIFNYEKYYGIDASANIDFRLEILNRPLKLNYRLIFQYYIKKKPVQISEEFGWSKKITKRSDLSRSGKQQAKRQTYRDINSNVNNIRMNESIRMLNSIIDWSKQNNVNVVLLTTPTHLYYREKLNQEQLEITIKTATELALNNENCMYLNLLSDNRFSDEDYRDAHHLNPSGAAKMSKLVNLKIKEFQ